VSEIAMRENLGDYSSIVCLKALVVGLENILGENGARVNLVLAGRIRGQTLVRDLGLSNTEKPLAEWFMVIKNALGKNGTRLCELVRIEEDGDILRVYLSETVCSAGEEQGSARRLTFTLGAILGAVEEAIGKKFTAKQTGSVLRGQDYDIIDLQER